MIEIINQTPYGCVEYVVGNEEEIKQLPLRGIKSGSSAMVISTEGVTMFLFKRPSKTENGEWVRA